MQNQLRKIKQEALNEIRNIKNSKNLEKFENFYFSRKKGKITELTKKISHLEGEKKRSFGKQINEVRSEILNKIKNKEQNIKKEGLEKFLKEDWIDITLPCDNKVRGGMHPISLICEHVSEIFTSLGFMILDGPELESDFYTFEALNIPAYHPARDMQDTFYIKDGDNLVMRTHTSSVQVRAMQKYGAPLAAIVSGRVFRNEATDASHEHTFNQIEGVMVDKNITIANLKAVITSLFIGIFGEKIETRFRPGYFSYVEPGLEVDIKCVICSGKGCSTCKRTGWVEFMGCGIIHPKVFEYGKIDSKKYSGFAFGFGLERLTMMKYGINDIRLFHNGDLRFLEQF